MFGGSTVPSGWAACEGQQLSISSNTALYSLLGTTYGGDGVNYFNLPDLRGRVALHWSAGHPVGEAAGEQQVALMQENLPAHTHIATAAAAGGSDDPTGRSWGPATDNVYAATTTPVLGMNPLGLSTSGSGTPHENMIPYVAVAYIIALQGIFPSPPLEE